VALVAPALWTRIPLYLPGLARIAVARSRRVGLHLHWTSQVWLRSFSEDPCPLLLELLVTNNNVRSLAADLPNPWQNGAAYAQGLIYGLLNAGTPDTLVDLDMRLPGGSQLQIVASANLRRLCLEKCPFEVAIAPTKLHQLVLCRAVGTAPELCRLLQQTPKLRYLNLRGFMGQDTSSAPFATGLAEYSISLPKLVELSIAERPAYLVPIMQSLHMPALQELFVQIHLPSDTDLPAHSVVDACDALMSHPVIQSWGDLPCLKIQIFQDEEFGTIERSMDSADELPSFELIVPVPATNGMQLLTQTACGLPSKENVTTLELCLMTPVEQAPQPADLVELLRSTHRLQHVVIHQDAASWVLLTLLQNAALCPELDTLALRDFNLSDPVNHDWHLGVLDSLALITAPTRGVGLQRRLRRVELVDCVLDNSPILDASEVESRFSPGSVEEIVVSAVEPVEAEPFRGGLDEDWDGEDPAADPDDGGWWVGSDDSDSYDGIDDGDEAQD
jgi:hypothetical protein